MLPLEDIKILDTTQYLPGPFCSMWLGDEEILISAGYSKIQIEGLKSIGAIAQT